jgi:D-3-phosphoglycerate dehydrogenase
MKVLIADKFAEQHLDSLKKLGCDVTYDPKLSAADLPKIIAPYKILIVRSTEVTAATIEAGAALELIIRAGAGVNTIDVKAASAKGVYVTNCPGKNSVAVAELVFALLLALDRRIADNVAALRAHKWNKKEFSKADGVFGKTLGVVGVGQIGREVIARAQAFGLKVIAWSRALTPEKAAELGVGHRANVDDIFREADIISLHVALKPETKHLVNAERLAMMKPNAILINTARGEVVDQAALLKALQSGKIRAGLDVYDGEPAEAVADFNDPILDLPNLYGTHHIGASTEQAQDAIARETVRIVDAYVKTGAVFNCVNLAKKSPAKFQLNVRHYDRVGVLASVLDAIRRANINVQEVENIIFDGAVAATCRIRLDSEPNDGLLKDIRANKDVISAELLRIG